MALHLQHSLTRLGHAQRGCCLDHWVLQLSQNVSQRENSFHFSTGGGMHAGVCLVKTKADLGHRLSEYAFCKDRAVSEVTFLNHHILPNPWLPWVVPFHLCLDLRHWSLHSSFPVLPSFTHSHTIKLTLFMNSSFPDLHTFYSHSSPLQTATFSMPANCWLSLPFLIRNTPSCELKWEKSLLSPALFSTLAADSPILEE